MKNHIVRFPGRAIPKIEDFEVVCDNSQSDQETRMLKADIRISVEDFRWNMTFIVDKKGVTNIQYTRYLKFGGKWFREEKEN